ncbi:MAG: gluconokinase [Burkholderiales bacterium]
MNESIHVVLMGVAGCGKSVVGQRIARLLDLPMIEGDAFHPQSNVEKMARGEPLDDADRAGWLQILGQQLQNHPKGAVLACSALKKKYRDVLRCPVPGLAFVHLSITPEESQRRVSSRPDHFYPPSLVASQFEALQDPADEPGVLVVDGTHPVDDIARQATQWLRDRTHSP